jgi:hypothetical protein
MMTVVLMGRRARRASQMILFRSPRGWGFLPAIRSESRAWTPETAAGSAKPGRGGRRKRKVDRAKIRAHIGQGVERKSWPLVWQRRVYLCRPQSPRTSPFRFPVPPGFAPSFLCPMVLEPYIPIGRRERRRRAKLRRRRARRRSGWTTIPMAPGMWRALAMHWMFKREAQRLRDEMLAR